MILSPRVSLIGAGPGDPGLLTLRGAELLARSDVVLYDGLSNPTILRHARPTAVQICVGKHGQSRIWRQSEIIDEILRHARAGRRVARLKGGDPAVFARTAEEVEALHAAGIAYEIVPGITAALAAGSYAGIPVTHRGLASAVALVTGHEEPGKPESSLDWDALARFPGTLVVYMGVTTAESWTASLLAAGKPAQAPAAIVRRCSLPDQRVIRCRLDEVARQLTPASKLRPPVIVIVGPVAELADTTRWFDCRPLFGRTVLVTRPDEQADELASPLRDLGAEALIQPAIAIGPPRDWSPVDAALERLDRFATIVFSSRNGVRFFLERLLATGRDVRHLGGARLAVVGKRTAEALAEFHLRADVVPDDFRAESLADALSCDVRDREVLVVAASRSKETLPDRLRDAGANVTQVVCYEHTDVPEPDPRIRDAVESGKIDWITVTSSATARNLERWFGDAIRRARIASLSPITSATLRDSGFAVDAEADPYTMESLVEAIVRAESDR